MIRRAVIRRAVDIASPRWRSLLSAPVLALAMLAIRLETPRAGRSTASAASACDGRPFDVLKLRTMVDGAEHIGAGLAVNANDPRITRVGALLRRTSLDELPNLRQRAARRDVADRPAPDAAGAGRAVHRAPARAPRDQARDHRLGAGQRPRVAAVVASGSSSTSTTSSTARSRSTCASCGAPCAMVLGGSGLYKGAGGRLGG